MMRRVVLCGVLLLSACATPRERCVRDATRDLATVNALIAETEATLARGYALRREAYTRPRLTFCAGTHHSHVGFGWCTERETVYRTRPVAVDLNEERAKLASLREKKRELEVRTRAALRACEGLADG